MTTTTTTTITPAQAAILLQFLAPIKEQIEVGTHVVEGQTIAFDLSGIVKRGADYARTPTVSIPFKKVIALMIDIISGRVQEKQKAKLLRIAQKILVRAMKESLSPEQKGEAFDEAMHNVEAAEAAVKEWLGELPKATTKGRTDVKDGVVVVKATEAA